MKSQIVTLYSALSLLCSGHIQAMVTTNEDSLSNSLVYNKKVLNLKSSHEALRKFETFPNLESLEIDINDLDLIQTFPKLKTLKIYGTVDIQAKLLNKETLKSKISKKTNNQKKHSIIPDIIPYKLWHLPELQVLTLNNQLLPDIPRYTVAELIFDQTTYLETWHNITPIEPYVIKEISFDQQNEFSWTNHQGWTYSLKNKRNIWPINIYLNKTETSMFSIDQAATRTGETLLSVETLYTNVNLVKWLIKQGANVNVKNVKDWTPLHTAALVKNHEIAQLLINNGANINSLTNLGWTPLMIASEEGDFETAKLLIDHNAKINVKAKDRSSAIYVAAQNGHLDIVKLLVENGANVNDRVTGEWTPLIVASEQGHLEIVKFLLLNNADINQTSADKWSALLVASEQGHVDIVKALIDANADINSVNSEGASPLYTAILNGHTQIAKLLLKNPSISIETINGSERFMPLQAALIKNNLDIAESLVKHNADINAPVYVDDFSLIHIATLEKRLDQAAWLLEHGANLDNKAANGVTPTILATSLGSFKSMKWLVEHGANINETNDYGETPLMFAAKDGLTTFVIWLSSKGADINSRDNRGFTPLMWAALHGRLDVVKFLVNSGACIDLIADDGSNAAQLAASHRHWETVDFLAKKLSVKRQKISPSGINLPPCD